MIGIRTRTSDQKPNQDVDEPPDHRDHNLRTRGAGTQRVPGTGQNSVVRNTAMEHQVIIIAISHLIGGDSEVRS